MGLPGFGACFGFGARAAFAEPVQVTLSVPTEVPCAVMADGTVVGPSSWSVSSLVDAPANLSGVSVSGAPDGVSFSAVKGDGSTAFSYSDGVASLSGGLAVPARGSASLSWDFSQLDAVKNSDLLAASAAGAAQLCAVSMTFSAEPVAFAVYSDDDKSLRFYKRTVVPAVGSTFEGRTVTQTYRDVENLTIANHAVDGHGLAFEGVPWASVASSVERVEFVDEIAPQTLMGFFSNMSSLTTDGVSLKNLDTTKAANASGMFYGCSSLTSLDLSGLDFSSYQIVNSMLNGCSSLVSVTLPRDLHSAKNLGHMFYGCAKLQNVDLSPLAGASPQYADCVFMGCTALMGVSGFDGIDFSKCETLASMFESCTSLRELDTSKLDASSAANVSRMFFHNGLLTSLDLSRFSLASAVDAQCLFDGCTSLKEIEGLADWNLGNAKNVLQMFYGCQSLEDIDMSKWHLAPTDSIQATFYNCFEIKELDLTGWDLSSVEYEWRLFTGCRKLEKITFGEKWKWATYGVLPTPDPQYIKDATGKWYDASTGAAFSPAGIPAGVAATYVATDPKTAFAVYSADDNSLDFYKRMDVPTAGSTFEGKAATEVYTGILDKTVYVDSNKYPHGPWEPRSFDVGSVHIVDNGIRPKTVAGWFSFFGNCSTFSGLEKLDLSDCSDAEYLFYRCTKLTSISLPAWDLKVCTNMGGLFESCTHLKSADLSNLKIGPNLESAWFLFSNCLSLETVNLSGFDTSAFRNYSHMFHNCSKLRALDLSSFSSRAGGAIIDDMLTGCFNLESVTFGAKWAWGGSDGFSLPTISADNVAGADGKWHAASDGAAYSGDAIPANKADTYYSVAPSKTLQTTTNAGDAAVATVSADSYAADEQCGTDEALPDQCDATSAENGAISGVCDTGANASDSEYSEEDGSDSEEVSSQLEAEEPEAGGNASLPSAPDSGSSE